MYRIAAVYKRNTIVFAIWCEEEFNSDVSLQFENLFFYPGCIKLEPACKSSELEEKLSDVVDISKLSWFKISSHDVGFYSEGNVYLVKEKGETCIEWHDELTALDLNYIQSMQVFKKRFAFHGCRHFDRNTQLYISKNTLQNRDSIDFEIFASSLVVYSFSVFETGLTNEISSNLKNELEDAISKAEKLEVPENFTTLSSRTNGLSVTLSLTCVLMLLNFIRNDFLSVIRIGKWISIKVNSHFFLLYYGPNLSRCASLSTASALILKDNDELDYFKKVLDVTCLNINGYLKNTYYIKKTPEIWVAESRESFEIRDFVKSTVESKSEDGQKYLAIFNRVSRIERKDIMNLIATTHLEDIFDSQWYLEAYADVALSGIDALQHFQEFGYKEGRLPCRLISYELEKELWVNWDSPEIYIKELKDIAENNDTIESSYAAFALGRWFSTFEQWSESLYFLELKQSNSIPYPEGLNYDLLLLTTYIKNQKFSCVWKYLNKYFTDSSLKADICYVVSNVLGEMSCVKSMSSSSSNEQARLRWINHKWKEVGLASIRFSNKKDYALFDRIEVSGECIHSTELTNKKTSVSVIVPVFNAESYITTSLKSILNQTLFSHDSLTVEVIVVDDASTDNTYELVKQLAIKHDVIKLIKHEINQGAYAARNLGLHHSKGDFITVQDADDWAHPQKLEKQLIELLTNDDLKATCSCWVRADNNLIFGTWRMDQSWVYRNISSLMIRREVFDNIGYWDEVRVEADTEFYHRMIKAFGSGSVRDVYSDVPLSFGRVLPTALTNTKETHLITQFSGLRSEYRKAAFAWHDKAKDIADLYIPYKGDIRPFKVPVNIIHGNFNNG